MLNILITIVIPTVIVIMPIVRVEEKSDIMNCYYDPYLYFERLFIDKCVNCLKYLELPFLCGYIFRSCGILSILSNNTFLALRLALIVIFFQCVFILNKKAVIK